MKRFFKLLLALLLILGSISIQIKPQETLVHAETISSRTARIHYQRADGDYTRWAVYAWNKNQQPGDTLKDVKLAFTQSDAFGAYVDIDLDQFDTPVQDLGFLVFKYLGDEVDFSGGPQSGDYGIETSNVEIGHFTNAYVRDGEANLVDDPFYQGSERVKTLRIHYQRPDGNYTPWNLWIWTSVNGELNRDSRVEFTGSDSYGVYVDIDTSQWKLSQTMGIIVRTDEWAKDPDGDRFISLFMSDDNPEGLKEVFLKSNDSTMYDKDGNVLDTNISALQLKKIGYLGNNQIEIEGLSGLNDPSILLVDQDGTLLTATREAFSTGSLSAYFTVAGAGIDIRKRYRLQVVDTTSEKINVSAVSELKYSSYYETSDFKSKYEPTRGSVTFGATITSNQTTFNVWTPTATSVILNVYDSGTPQPQEAVSQYPLTLGDKGVWSAVVNENLEGKYYTYSITNYGKTQETADLYTYSSGANGIRTMVVDPYKKFAADTDQFVTTKPEDAILYEAHVRDLTTSPTTSVSEANRGKFNGVVERGTTNGSGQKTSFDHIVDLGVTHVHFLPVFDFYTIDETKVNEPDTCTGLDCASSQFNWGYDPQNYTSIEGSYSSNPYDGNVRMEEFKNMVEQFHSEDIGVVMDVVYNHVYSGSEGASDNLFEKTVPDYYFRMTPTGSFSNGSACGNETASDHTMFRNYMLDSLKVWAEVYKVDGFRFDLMALHDIETMNMIADELRAINPNVVLYGEGWHAGGAALDETKQAKKANAYLLHDIGVFNDDIRDGIKGSVFESTQAGFITGNNTTAEFKDKTIFGILGATQRIGGLTPYTSNGKQVINYVSAHDNLTLYDKLVASTSKGNLSDEAYTKKLINLQIMANTIVLTSNGIPFIHAGAELMRSKGGDHNSYNKPDAVNQINYDNLNTYGIVNEYYKGLIETRKNHPIFKMVDKTSIQTNEKILDPISGATNSSFGYELYDANQSDDWNKVAVLLNASPDQTYTYQLTAGKWHVFADSTQIQTNFSTTMTFEAAIATNNTIAVKPNSLVMVYMSDADDLSALINKVKEKDTYNPLQYTKATWQALASKISEAQAILDNPDEYTKADVDQMIIDLTQKYDALEMMNQGDTAEDAIQINSKEDYFIFMETILNKFDYTNKYVVLNTSIDFEGAEVDALGAKEGLSLTNFNGTFDGHGNTLSNATFKSETGNYVGMFASLGGQGTIKNMVLDNVQVNGTYAVGSVVGFNDGIIENVFVNSSVKGNDRVVGGVVGYNSGIIRNVHFEGNVASDTSIVGGIAGMNTDTIENSIVSASVKGGAYAGVVTGHNTGTIQQVVVLPYAPLLNSGVKVLVDYNSVGATIDSIYYDETMIESEVVSQVGTLSNVHKITGDDWFTSDTLQLDNAIFLQREPSEDYVYYPELQALQVVDMQRSETLAQVGRIEIDVETLTAELWKGQSLQDATVSIKTTPNVSFAWVDTNEVIVNQTTAKATLTSTNKRYKDKSVDVPLLVKRHANRLSASVDEAEIVDGTPSKLTIQLVDGWVQGTIQVKDQTTGEILFTAPLQVATLQIDVTLQTGNHELLVTFSDQYGDTSTAILNVHVVNDKTALIKLVKDSLLLRSSDYTQVSWDTMLQERTLSQLVLDKDTARQSEIDAHVEAMKNVIDTLNPVLRISQDEKHLATLKHQGEVALGVNLFVEKQAMDDTLMNAIKVLFDENKLAMNKYRIYNEDHPVYEVMLKDEKGELVEVAGSLVLRVYTTKDLRKENVVIAHIHNDTKELLKPIAYGEENGRYYLEVQVSNLSPFIIMVENISTPDKAADKDTVNTADTSQTPLYLMLLIGAMFVFIRRKRA